MQSICRKVCQHLLEMSKRQGTLIKIFRIFYLIQTRCTVLFSGDTGFYSGAKKLADILKKDGYEVQIFPGISSVIYLAARVGKSWEDAKIISMHGRSQNFIHVVANHEKTFLILGKSAGKEICEKLKYYHLEQVTVSVGNHLSYPDEEIVIKKGNELQAEDFGDQIGRESKAGKENRNSSCR